MAQTIAPEHFRQVLGQYPTGVVVVTALDSAEEPVGMTVGSFVSVSLDPPLVAFLPDRKSSSWAKLRAASDNFCVNILGSDQEQICRAVASRKTNKFEGIGWQKSAEGNPVLDGSVAWIDCKVDTIHEAGDHHIVVGEVQDLGVTNNGYPLLFFRSGYGSFIPLSMAAGDADLLEQLQYVDLVRPRMEELAQRFSSEVTAVALVRDELVLAASAGRPSLVDLPTRVGRRTPFAPPLGSVFAAFGGDAIRDRWLSQMPRELPESITAALQEMPDRVKERGYSIILGHEQASAMEMAFTRHSDGDSSVSMADVMNAMGAVAPYTNPEDDSSADAKELRSLTAPVFGPDERLLFELILWGPTEPIGPAEITERAEALRRTAAQASADLADSLTGQTR